MKKIILSLALILAFAGFSAYQWFGMSNNQIIYVAPETSKSVLPISSQLVSPTVSNTPTGGATPPPQPTSIVIHPTQVPATPTPAKNAGPYRNGQYTGSVVDAYYGNVQVEVTIQNGFIADVQFLQYPNDRSTSRAVNGYAMPLLQQEAIQTQNANVDVVSGATDTSGSFRQSLAYALSQAQ